MIRTALLALLSLLSACSLIHQDSPNEAPVVEMARFVCISADGQRDTLSMGETCLTRRGGEVELSAFATDEDDDPLFYRWTSFGAGSFRDSLAAETSWFAPQEIESNSEIFLIQASISDRDCSAVALEEEPIVQAIRAALPELDRRRTNQPASPRFGQGDLTARRVFLVQSRPLLIEHPAGLDRRRLVARPRTQLRFVWT